MPVKTGDTVQMEGVELIFRNFEGRAGKFNDEGKRNFGVLLPVREAEAMAADGWNVKTLKPGEEAEEGDEPKPWLPVALGYEIKPPTVAIVTDRGPTRLTEDQVEMLDWADITNVDLIVRAYLWEARGEVGVKAYVKTLVVTIEEDELEKKYALNDAGHAPTGDDE